MKVEAIRLTPTMVSRKLQLLDFVRAFYSAHGVGPTITEMANALNCARSRIQDAVRKLEREQLINRQPGKTRGITPISGHEEAIRQLQAIGYIVNPGRMELLAPAPPLLDLDERGRLTIG
ncbi:MAG: hypothetical protein CL949_19695 [Erythrobacter sp.]|nr:hypothetical protein [Erythrobacter sp.]|tara:strand:- start:1 stop:360 length:360 start_codon:yes stop_codon:yes gene_type:complete